VTRSPVWTSGTDSSAGPRRTTTWSRSSETASRPRRCLRPASQIVLASVSLQAQISFDRLLRADREPQNWLTYSGTFLSQRYSQLAQVTPDNVKNLEPQWIFQARSTEKFEPTAIVVDGIMYTVQPPNDIVALDAATGRTFWMYSYRPSTEARPCCGRVNRGVAILGDTLFMGTIDGIWSRSMPRTAGRSGTWRWANRRRVMP
jgi:glucose dehydrogenase